MKRRYKYTIASASVAFACVTGFAVYALYQMGTYRYTVKENWGVELPAPAHEKTILSTRGSIFGDGNAITELQYNRPSDIERIRHLSDTWVNGRTFAKKEHSLSLLMQNLLKKHVDMQAQYFYLEKLGTDDIVFQLKGHTLTVYESYL